jgi:hypothetical protein
LIASGPGRVIASRAAAVKPKADQKLLLMEFGFLDRSGSARDAHVPNNEPESEKVPGHNLPDGAFRLVGLSLIVLQLPVLSRTRTGARVLPAYPLVPQVDAHGGSYFFIRWHSALLSRPAHFRSIASPRSGASTPGHLPTEQTPLSPHVCCRAECGMRCLHIGSPSQRRWPSSSGRCTP